MAAAIFSLDYQSVNTRSQTERKASRKQKPRVITPGLCGKPVEYLVRQTLLIVTRLESKVNSYFMSGRTEGGRVELQWLMSHSLV
jgi:hypothetical protein